MEELLGKQTKDYVLKTVLHVYESQKTVDEKLDMPSTYVTQSDVKYTVDEEPYLTVNQPLSQATYESLGKAFNSDQLLSAQGVIPKEMLYVKQVIGETSYMFFYPKGVRHIHYHNKSGKYPHPNLLFLYKDNSFYVFAIKAELTKLTSTTPIYFAPFLNLNLKDSRMCTGTVPVRQVVAEKKFSSIMDTMTRLFFDTGFNNGTGDGSQVIKGGYSKFLKEFKDVIEIDNDMLIKHPTFKNYGQLIKFIES